MSIRHLTIYHLVLYVGRECLPFLPTTGAGYLQTSQQRSLQAVDVYLYLSATQTAGYSGRELLGGIAIELHVLQLDVVAIVDIRHINADFVVLFGLYTATESHRLGLHLLIGVKSGDGLHTLVGRHDGGEAAVRVILELLHSYASAKAAAPGELARVVEEIRVTLVVGHTAMVGERLGIAQGHNLSGIGPGARRMRSRAVADMFGHTACSIEQLIGLGTWDLELGTVNLAEPGAFHIRILIFLSLLAFVHRRASEGFFRHIQLFHLTVDGNHIVVQLSIIDLRIPPHNPRLDFFTPFA